MRGLWRCGFVKGGVRDWVGGWVGGVLCISILESRHEIRFTCSCSWRYCLNEITRFF